MKLTKCIGIAVAGALAGTINGLYGAGGGMILVPLLTLLTRIEENDIFPTSVSIILPVCVISLLFRLNTIQEGFTVGLPFLLGSIPGGLLAGFLGHRIPVKWLHRGLGLLILWGGVRYLC